MTKNASLHDLTISDFSCQPMLEKIEDKYDLEFLQQPMIEDDGIRISVQDLFDEFGTYYTNLYLQKKTNRQLWKFDALTINSIFF